MGESSLWETSVLKANIALVSEPGFPGEVGTGSGLPEDEVEVGGGAKAVAQVVKNWLVTPVPDASTPVPNVPLPKPDQVSFELSSEPK